MRLELVEVCSGEVANVGPPPSRLPASFADGVGSVVMVRSLQNLRAQRQPTAPVAIVLLLALGLAPLLVPGPALGQTATASYELIFVATWSEQSHPRDFPPGPHFSGLIGAVHSSVFELWREGELASPGMERMAELGAKSPLDIEVFNAITAGGAAAVISGGGIGTSPGQVAVELTVSQNHPLVSVVSMIAPSPDWFVGVDSLSLLGSGDWVEMQIVDLFAYDTGTDSGATYTSADENTFPPEPIARIEGAPFAAGVPLGQFVFRRTDSPALPKLALRQGRFEVSAVWATSRGDRGIGQPTQITDDTGYFWFFSESNTEVLVKVLLGCSFNDHFWVFAGGLTNLEVQLVIEDTDTGALRGYTNPLDLPFVPIQDTAAFATCP